MTEEHVPVALAYAHASVAKRRFPTAIVHRSASVRTEEVDQELILAHNPVLTAVRPEATELRIGSEAGQQIVRYRRDRVISTKAVVKRLLVVARSSPPREHSSLICHDASLLCQV